MAGEAYEPQKGLAYRWPMKHWPDESVLILATYCECTFDGTFDWLSVPNLGPDLAIIGRN